MSAKRPLHVGMVAYAHYFTDARIKNYVDALLDEGATVDVFALGKETGARRDGNLFVNSLDTKYQGDSTATYVALQAMFLLKALWHLLVGSFHQKYDVVHVHNMPNILTLAALPLKLFGTRVILDVHDTMPEAYATKFGFALESVPIRVLVQEELLSAACAEKVITTNVMHKEVLVGHGIATDKIDLILNVGNRKIFKPRPHDANSSELWLGYHGTIAKRLGVLLIVDALALLKVECPNLRFLCVGEGDDLEDMKRRAEAHGVARMIEWKPFTSVELLPEALRKVQVGIIGNQRETELKRNFMLPVKMLEYAAMEIPTIVPRLKIIERYFDESSAFFYTPDDSRDLAETIRTIYNDRAHISARIEGLKRFNNEYNWDVMADRYMHIINELVSR